jgi:hypothetical protein
VDSNSVFTSVEKWAGDRWSQLETGVNDFMDRLTIRRYDRRAPVIPTPTATASPTTPAMSTPRATSTRTR